jgi:hypothetical protein
VGVPPTGGVGWWWWRVVPGFGWGIVCLTRPTRLTHRHRGATGTTTTESGHGGRGTLEPGRGKGEGCAFGGGRLGAPTRRGTCLPTSGQTPSRGAGFFPALLDLSRLDACPCLLRSLDLLRLHHRGGAVKGVCAVESIGQKVERVAGLVPDSWFDDARREGGNALVLRVRREFGVGDLVAFEVASVVARRVAVARGWVA